MTDNDATQTRQDDADVSKELRRTLDEHGVKWKSIDFDVSKTTLFYAGSEQYIFDDGGGIASPMLAGSLTPAQVIAATVAQDLFIHGPEMNEQTCTVESMHGFTDAYVSTRYFVELSCHTIDDWGDSEPPQYCPYCGRKVVDE